MPRLRFDELEAIRLIRCETEAPKYPAGNAAAFVSELSAQRLEFCAACLAEIAEEIDRPAVRHLPQLEKRLVRLQIRIDDPSRDQLGTFDHLRRGQDPHSAHPDVKLDQRRCVRFVVLERVDIAFRSHLDKFVVELLSVEFVLREPLCPCLCMLSQPRREDRCKSACDGSCECRKGGNYRCVHEVCHVTGSLLTDVMGSPGFRNRLPKRDQVIEERQCRMCEKFGIDGSKRVPRAAIASRSSRWSTSSVRVMIEGFAPSVIPIEECRNATQHMSSDSLN